MVGKLNRRGIKMKLHLLWQNNETRQFYHVGNLEHIGDEYVFSYMLEEGKRKLKEAMENGYRPHLSFPDIQREYKSSQLFGAFARRTPDSKRPDYKAILNDLGLPQDSTVMDLLRATGGRLMTDSYEFLAPLHFELDGSFSVDFFIRGLRYYDWDNICHQLVVGDELKLECEPDSPKDNKAVAIFTKDGKNLLGYIPSPIYSEFIFDNKEVLKIGAEISKINEYAKPQQRICVRVQGLELQKNIIMDDNTFLLV